MTLEQDCLIEKYQLDRETVTLILSFGRYTSIESRKENKEVKCDICTRVKSLMFSLMYNSDKYYKNIYLCSDNCLAVIVGTSKADELRFESVNQSDKGLASVSDVKLGTIEKVLSAEKTKTLKVDVTYWSDAAGLSMPDIVSNILKQGAVYGLSVKQLDVVKRFASECKATATGRGYKSFR